MTVRILLVLCLLVASPSARSAWDAGVGMEDYQWIEYSDLYGNPKEAGLRAALFVDWRQEGDQGALFAWRAKFYGGTVYYDTFLISDGTKVSTKTDYGGVLSEAQLFHRDDLGAYRLDYLSGLGLDFWRRSIRSNGSNQIEDYSVWFVRAGLRLAKPEREAGFHAECGVKYPFSVGENAHLTSLNSPAGYKYTTNPGLSPGGRVSGYAELGYRINARLDMVGYYDSWRFARSPDVMASDTSGRAWLIHQPKSTMDAWGIKLLTSF